MYRRGILKGAAVLGVAALGAGFWALPSIKAPAALTFEGVMGVLDQLQATPLSAVKGWSPAQVFNHCAQSIDFSLDGYPELKPVWFRRSVGPLVFDVFSARGAMRHPLDEPIPGAQALDEPADVQAALLRLRQSFARFAAHTGELQPHFAYGALSHEQYIQAHVMHLFNHLSLLQPQV